MVSAYELPDDELVNRFADVCFRLGTSGSGLIQAGRASWDAIEVEFMKGVMRARLAKVAPPFKSGDKVRVRNPENVRLIAGLRLVKSDETLEVARVFYLRDEWLLAFKGYEQPFDYEGFKREWRYRAMDFEGVVSVRA